MRVNDKAPRLRIIDGGLARPTSNSRRLAGGNRPVDLEIASQTAFPGGKIGGSMPRLWLAAAFACVIMSSLAICSIAAVWLLRGGAPLLAWHPTNVYYTPAAGTMQPPSPQRVASVPGPRPVPLRKAVPRAANASPVVVFLPVPGPAVKSQAPIREKITAPAHTPFARPGEEDTVKEAALPNGPSADKAGGPANQLAVWRKGEPIVVAVANQKGGSADSNSVEVVVRLSTISALFRALPAEEQRTILDELSKKVLAMYAGKNSGAAPPPAEEPPAKDSGVPKPSQTAANGSAASPGGTGATPPSVGSHPGGKPDHVVT